MERLAGRRGDHRLDRGWKLRCSPATWTRDCRHSSADHRFLDESLGDGVGPVRGVAGGAILGDGRVGLILDVAEICALAQSGEALDEIEEEDAVTRPRRRARRSVA